MGSVVTEKKAPQQRININSTETQLSPQTGSDNHEKCDHCGMRHPTRKCFKLMKLPEPELQKRINELRPCHKCGKSGHVARNCKAVPCCDNCKNPHLTIYHKLLVKKNLLASLDSQVARPPP